MSKDSRNTNTNTNTTVLVTGATDFVESHVVKQLLASLNPIYNVIGTIRGDPKSPEYQWLYDLNISNQPSRFKLVSADLLKDGSFDEYISQSDYVLHMASPHIFSPKDVQKDLIDPAINGTKNVLESCKKAYFENKRLKKVIITSSTAAITDSPDSNKKYTEKDWNLLSTPNRNPFYYSKATAEKYVWKWFYENGGKIENWEQLKVFETYIKSGGSNAVSKKSKIFDLCVINPSIPIGAELHNNKKNINAGNNTFVRAINGEFPFKMNLNWSFVDVRDVAHAHILVMNREGACGRYIVADLNYSFQDMYEHLVGICEGENIKSRLPCCPCHYSWCACFVWCTSFTQDKGTGDWVRTNLNKVPTFDNSRIKELGLQFHEAPISDSVRWAIKVGLIDSIEKRKTE